MRCEDCGLSSSHPELSSSSWNTCRRSGLDTVLEIISTGVIVEASWLNGASERKPIGHGKDGADSLEGVCV